LDDNGWAKMGGLAGSGSEEDDPHGALGFVFASVATLSHTTSPCEWDIWSCRVHLKIPRVNSSTSSEDEAWLSLMVAFESCSAKWSRAAGSAKLFCYAYRISLSAFHSSLDVIDIH
jgi:hypothetical protein